jgi:hypothetical protein
VDLFGYTHTYLDFDQASADDFGDKLERMRSLMDVESVAVEAVNDERFRDWKYGEGVVYTLDSERFPDVDTGYVSRYQADFSHAAPGLALEVYVMENFDEAMVMGDKALVEFLEGTDEDTILDRFLELFS